MRLINTLKPGFIVTIIIIIIIIINITLSD